MEQVDIKPGD